jgi:hypothetical protein
LGLCELQICKETVDCLFHLMVNQVFSGYVTTACALLPWARNTVIQGAYSSNPNFTHILFIDDDMCGFTVDSVNLLLDADKDIISGVMTHRKYPYKVVTAFKKPMTIEDLKFQRIVEADHTGTAFTLIKRKVLDALREETHDGGLWFHCDREPRYSFENEKAEWVKDKLHKIQCHDNAIIPFNFEDLLNEAIFLGETSHLGSQMFGEDVGFCKRARKAGFTVWVHAGVVVGHIGQKVCNVMDTLEIV